MWTFCWTWDAIAQQTFMTFIICCHFTMTNSKPLLRASESKVFPKKQKLLMFEKSDTVANCFWKASMAFETRLSTRKSTNPMWTKNSLSVDSQLKGKYPRLYMTLLHCIVINNLKGHFVLQKSTRRKHTLQFVRSFALPKYFSERTEMSCHPSKWNGKWLLQLNQCAWNHLYAAWLSVF